MSKKLTLEEKLARVEDVFVGLWNYRAKRGKPSWTATFLFQGRYHDTRHYDTPSEALDALYRGAQRLKSRHGDPFACAKCGKKNA